MLKSISMQKLNESNLRQLLNNTNREFERNFQKLDQLQTYQKDKRLIESKNKKFRKEIRCQNNEVKKIILENKKFSFREHNNINEQTDQKEMMDFLQKYNLQHLIKYQEQKQQKQQIFKEDLQETKVDTKPKMMIKLKQKCLSVMNQKKLGINTSFQNKESLHELQPIKSPNQVQKFEESINLSCNDQNCSPKFDFTQMSQIEVVQQQNQSQASLLFNLNQLKSPKYIQTSSAKKVLQNIAELQGARVSNQFPCETEIKQKLDESQIISQNNFENSFTQFTNTSSFKNSKKKIERVYSDRNNYSRLQQKFYEIRRNGHVDDGKNEQVKKEQIQSENEKFIQKQKRFQELFQKIQVQSKSQTQRFKEKTQLTPKQQDIFKNYLKLTRECQNSIIKTIQNVAPNKL